MRPFYQLNIMGYLVDLSSDFSIVGIYDWKSNSMKRIDFYKLPERTRYDILDHITNFENAVNKGRKAIYE